MCVARKVLEVEHAADVVDVLADHRNAAEPGPQRQRHQPSNRLRITHRRAASLADTRYRAGLASFLEVLEARRAADASGERAAAALGRASRARILLWQALGGEVLASAAPLDQG